MTRGAAIVLATGVLAAVAVTLARIPGTVEPREDSQQSSPGASTEIAHEVTSEQWQQMLRRLDALEQEAGRSSSDRLPVERGTPDADAMRAIQSRIERLEAEIDELRSHIADARIGSRADRHA